MLGFIVVILILSSLFRRPRWYGFPFMGPRTWYRPPMGWHRRPMGWHRHRMGWGGPFMWGGWF